MAFKIAHPGVPESANSVVDAVTITVLDDDGSLNVDQLTLTGNSNASIKWLV
jgi:hypothetical protein